MRIGKRPQDDVLDDREDCGGGSDGESEGQDGDGSEAWRRSKAARAHPQVPDHVSHTVRAGGLRAVCQESLPISGACLTIERGGCPFVGRRCSQVTTRGDGVGISFAFCQSRLEAYGQKPKLIPTPFAS